MAKVKQLLIDIIESRESEDDYGFPDHPIYPVGVAVFDDSELADTNE